MPSADLQYLKLLKELVRLRLMVPARFTKEYLQGEEWKKRNERIKEINEELERLEPFVKGLRARRERI
jgi:hypothetical protein